MTLKFRVGTKRSWIPPGIYRFAVKTIEMTSRFKDKRILEFLFEVAEGEHRGTQLRGFCNADYETFSESTKLYQWYAAVTGDELEPGAEIDLDVFYGKVIEAEVEERVSQKTKNRFSNVTKIVKVVCEL